MGAPGREGEGEGEEEEVAEELEGSEGVAEELEIGRDREEERDGGVSLSSDQKSVEMSLRPRSSLF